MKWVIDWVEMLQSLADSGQLQIDPDIQAWFELVNKISTE